MIVTTEILQKIIDNDPSIHRVYIDIKHTSATPSLFDQALKAIGRNTFLSTIFVRLDSLNIDQENILSASLASNTSIRTISVGNIDGTKDEAARKINTIFEGIKKAKKLETLNLDLIRGGLPDDVSSIATVISCSSTLKKINLGRTRFNPAQLRMVFSALETCETLESLDLSYQELDPELFLLLGNFINKRVLPLSLTDNLWNVPTSFTDLLKRNQTLQTLNLNSLGDTGLETTTELFKAGTKIRSLIIASGTLVFKSSFEGLFLALKNYPWLEVLQLTDCSLGAEAGKALSEVIGAKNCSIKSLNLCRVNMGSSTVEASIMKALCRNTGLEFLEIDGSLAKNDLLEQLIRENKTLKSIKVRFIRITNGFTEVAKALSANTALESCTISTEKAKDEHIPLIETLLKAPSLKELRFYSHNISDEGISLLATYLEENTHLKTLGLSKSEQIDSTKVFGAGGGVTILRLLKTNSTLTYIDLNGINLDGITYKAIQYELQNHKGLDLFQAFILDFTQALIQTNLDAELVALEKMLDQENPEPIYMEAYRLFIGLKYMSYGHDHLALPYFLFRYSYSSLERVADYAIGLIFLGDYGADFKASASHEGKQARLLYILHSVGASIQLEIQNFAYIALFELMYPDRVMTVDDGLAIKSIAILRFSDIQTIAKCAIERLEAQAKNPYEIGLLKLIVTSPHDRRLTKNCSEINMFRNVFDARYPDKRSFICIEDCISLASEEKITDLIVNFPLQPPASVEPAESLQRLRDRLEKATLAVKSSLRFFKEVSADNAPSSRDNSNSLSPCIP